MPNNESYDVFIVGAGLAACTFAQALLKADLRVGMADAGGQHSLRAGENFKNCYTFQHDVDQYGGIVRGLTHPVSIPTESGQFYTRNALNPRQDPTKNLSGAVVAYCVGGMGIHWTCAVPRHHPTAEPIGDGIIGQEELDALYAEAEGLLNKHDDVHHTSLRHQAIKEDLIKTWKDIRDTPLAAKRVNGDYIRYTGADTVLGDLAATGGEQRLSILRQHRVSRLLHRQGKVHAVVVRDLVTREERRIEAKCFVVAAGWLHTAQILWNSQIRPSALGKYLTDHPLTACQVSLKKELVDKVRDLAAQQGQTFPEDDPVPIPMNDPTPHMYIPVTPERLWHGIVFREAFQFDPPTPPVDSRLIVDLKWFGMIDPVPTNRVTFEPDISDRLGMPQPTFHFELGEEDKQRELAMMDHMREVARQLGEYLPSSLPGHVPLGGSTHTMGATRMGTREDDSVANPYSKVWGFDNLYLGGNCLLPARNACNPTLTSVAMALRASRDLLAQIGATAGPQSEK